MGGSHDFAEQSHLLCSMAQDDGDCGAIGGMEMGTVNRSTLRQPNPASHVPPDIPYDQTRARTRTAAVGSQRQNA
jgi:hypothetical protein